MLDRIPVGPMVPLSVPKEFERLNDLAYNLWWCWHPEAVSLWSTVNPKAWASNPNPIPVLQAMTDPEWEALAANVAFTDQYNEAISRFDADLAGDGTWFSVNHGDKLDGPVAYLCAEYGIQERLRLYAGGLGVLAGDHVKAASDLGVPLVAVGLDYRRGYFQQAVDPDGNQQHTFLWQEPGRRPMRRVLDPTTGRDLTVTIDFPGSLHLDGDPQRHVTVGAWRLDVGRVPLLLLDTELPENDPADRPITHILYVRGREMRLAQEIVLGIGGVRILAALGIEPAAWHVNEGHAALSLLERLAGNGAREHDEIAASTLFTLHTPVPAGNERFGMDLAQRHLKVALPGIGDEITAELGAASDQPDGSFDMGALAIRFASVVNGVSQRHAEVVSQDWGHLIGGNALGITNGIHTPSWVGGSVARLFRKLFGEDWVRYAADTEAWEVLREVPNEDLWSAHRAQKRMMLRNLRAHLLDQHARHGDSPEMLHSFEEQLPEDRLTIGFARRFATYKRANLLFSDLSRLRQLLTDPVRPVQVVFAGKAHPADREGQGLIRWVVEMSRTPELAGHIFFIENYNIGLATSLVQGCDVWLNNPRPPKEASGTSGMKAAANGSLNLSVLDGWWVEGYNGSNGWGFGQEFTSDYEDAATLYHLLESEVVPRFYDRGEDGVPHAWVEMMKESMSSILPRFSARRMVRDYTEQAYLPLGSAEPGHREA